MAKQMNYRQIENAIAGREPFKHGDSMKATLENDTYTIWSYSTIIAVYHPEQGWWLNDNKYSSTTTRQQNLIKRAAFG